MAPSKKHPTQRSPRHSPQRKATAQSPVKRSTTSARPSHRSPSRPARAPRGGGDRNNGGALSSRSRVLIVVNGAALASFCLLAAFFVVNSVRSSSPAPTAGVGREARRTVGHFHAAAVPRASSKTARPSHTEDAAHQGAAGAIPENSRFVCVYHEASRRPGYGPDTFPYAYCHVVAYCCLPVDTSPEDTQALQSITRLANAHRPMAIIVTVGAGPTDTDLTALFSSWRAGQFTARLLDVRRRTAFCCVYLHWRRPSALYRDRVTRLAADLRAALGDHAVRLGFVVDGDTADALDVRALLTTLGRDSLLVAPAPLPASPAAHDLAYHGYEALRWHSHLAELSGNASGHACHTVSLAGVALGKGEPASATLVPYERICTGRFLRAPTVRDGWSSVGRLRGSGSLVSFLSPARARSFVGAVHEEAGSSCLGFWDPEYDDFGARCGGPHYPLVRAVVGHAVGR
ncbi:uncharacterized protein LOC144124359 [Amblyomma americanum]